MPGKKNKFVQLIGSEELAELLKGLLVKDLRPFLLSGTKESAEAVADRMRSYVPVDKGDLFSTIKVRRATGTGRRRLNRRKEFGHMAGHFKTSSADPFHAGFIEFGTKFIKAIRYQRRALDDTEPQVLSIMSRWMAHGLRETAAAWRRRLPVPKGIKAAPVLTEAR